MEPDRIPPVNVTGVGTIIPATASVLPEAMESPEVRSFNLSFANYRSDQCQIDGIEGKNATEALKILRDVGVYFISPDEYLKNSKQGVEIKPVLRDGDYAVLYKGLVEEEIHEIKFDKPERQVGLRVFYYLIPTERLFYVLAVRCTHYDTTKGTKREERRKRRMWR